ncbi:M4 family metallopeptidase [Polyangium fumosum]|nr:M4 family metallopeptidase [Polyangium fumosum]
MINRTILPFLFAGVALSAGCADIEPGEEETGSTPGAALTAREQVLSTELASGSLLVDTISEAVRSRDEAKARAAFDPVLAPAVARFTEGAGQYGLDRDHTFAVRNVNLDEAGERHARLDHFYKGIRVLSSTPILRTDKDGAIREEIVTGLRTRISVDTTPRLREEQARRAVEAQPERTGEPLMQPRVELVIWPISKRFVRATSAPLRGDEKDLNALDVERRVVDTRLVYQVDTLDRGRGEPLSTYRYLVDAQTGEVVHKKALSRPIEGIGRTFNNDGPLNVFQVSIDTRQYSAGGGTRFEPLDTFRNFGVWDEDTCKTCGANADVADNIWGDFQAFMGDATATTANRQTAIADGLFGMQLTWDMFDLVWGRQGYDDAFYEGNAFVHSDTDWNNAKYYYLSGNIAIGDGGPSARSAFTSLDTVAHEFGHGLNDFSADLGDNSEGEGLNEANSDIIGEIAEAYDLGNGQFLGLSSIPTSPGPSYSQSASNRNFRTANNIRYWTTGLEDLEDEHARALPMDHAFYFMSQTSVSDPISPMFSVHTPWGMQGIDIDKSAHIWIRALLNKFDSDTDYAQARTHCMSAASELFGAGSTEHKAVANAFAAINVGAVASNYPGSAVSMSESEPNNSQLAADAVAAGTLPAGAPVVGPLSKRTMVSGIVDSSDPNDYFTISVPAGKTLRVTLAPYNDDDLDIIDDWGTTVDSSALAGTSWDQATGTAPNDGLPHTYFIRVKYYTTSGTQFNFYQLYVDIL